MTSPDAPTMTSTTYTKSTIPGACDTLASPQTLPVLGFAHATDVYSLPSPFPFFGTSRTRYAVAEQGYVMLFDSMTADITTLVEPAQIPTADAPNGLIAPLWTFHLSYVPNRSAFRAAVASDHLTIEWTDFAIGSIIADTTSHITLQAKLFGSGVIELHYCTLNRGATMTGDETGAAGSVGIESPDGTKGVSGGFLQAVATTTSALRFTPM